MRQILLFLMLMVSTTWAEEIYLRDNLSRARVGDFIVTDQNQTNTLLLIAGKSDRSITIQEISTPEGCYSGSWREWVQSGAPGHTSWISYELDPRNGRLIESFSYTKNTWCDIPAADNFLGTLLNLPLTLMPDQSRRRVGSTDRRRVWQPKLIVDGRPVPDVSFRSWRTRWPNDGSELGSKLIEIYLPTEEGRYPSYFPYWLQVSGVIGKARMRIIDSGTGLQSPAPPMPKRPLAFMNNGRLEEGQLRFWLKTRPYYSDYTLAAIESGDSHKIIPLPYSIRQTEEPGTLLIEVPQKVLAEKLTAGKTYRFAMHAWNHPNSGTETRDPIRWETNR